MQYQIASPADYGQMARLYWAYATEENDSTALDEDEFTRRFVAFLETYMGVDYICWVAGEAGRIVSVVYIGMLEKMPSLSDERLRIGYVANVYTLPAFRNRGIAAELMDKVQDWARTHSFETLFVLPGEKSVPFFERQAFTADSAFMGYSFRKD